MSDEKHLLRAAAAIVCLLTSMMLAACPRPVPGLGKPLEEKGVFHEVRAGQTLWRICRTYGADIQQVAEINNIADPTRIVEGQVIFIPGATKEMEVETPAKTAQDEVRQPEVKKEPERFIWPVKGRVVSEFGVRAGKKHDGIDIQAPEGAPIAAAADGEVVYEGLQKGYGKLIVLKHDGGYFTVYAHQSGNAVKEGDKVRRGDRIGAVGSTGRTTGPHLHFEIREGGKPRNPRFLLPEQQ